MVGASAALGLSGVALVMAVVCAVALKASGLPEGVSGNIAFAVWALVVVGAGVRGTRWLSTRDAGVAHIFSRWIRAVVVLVAVLSAAIVLFSLYLRRAYDQHEENVRRSHSHTDGQQ